MRWSRACASPASGASEVEDPDIAKGALALAAATAGRLLLLSKLPRVRVSMKDVAITLAIEIPFTAATALLGWAICEALHLGQAESVVAIAILGRYGPERLEAWIDRIVPAPLRKQDPPEP